MEPAEYGMAWFLAFHHYKEGEKKNKVYWGFILWVK